jgi:hypothetical protein
MDDPKLPWDVKLIVHGIRIITAMTFIGFLCWTVWHLVRMFP